jgi:hypothetical protein
MARRMVRRRTSRREGVGEDMEEKEKRRTLRLTFYPPSTKVSAAYF